MRTNNPTTPAEGLLDDFNFGAVDLLATQADTCLVLRMRIRMKVCGFLTIERGCKLMMLLCAGYITVDGNSGERMNITFWYGGEALIQHNASSYANTIVVMHIVGQCRNVVFDTPRV
ncbi:hypothetical protein M422DRAFT_256362 [Sphaerobolus stellatus SS14]|uniref:Unplaced genomic scaffold SPHSTscaffold_67, whole genome shotgun sequence n=1 Tax=Sphaerobolus stellatus (strain SS14) TaxID=990650 RepID=A0A0C9VRQ0_SPHS4|nr:hypothetical protein M422DRAFT_256362 [Sphaerobolus stellatus SS14]